MISCRKLLNEWPEVTDVWRAYLGIGSFVDRDAAGWLTNGLKSQTILSRQQHIQINCQVDEFQAVRKVNHKRQIVREISRPVPCELIG